MSKRTQLITMNKLIVILILLISFLGIGVNSKLGKFSLKREQRESDLNPDGTPSGDLWSCNICKMTMFGFVKTINLEVTQNLIENYVIVNICNQVALNNTICPGIIKTVGNVLVNAVTSSILSPDYFCEEIAPTCVASGFTNHPAGPYIDSILKAKPKAA